MSCDPLVGPLHVSVGGAPAMAACVKAIVWPPTVKAVVRAAPDVFALVAYVTAPDPDPDAPALTVSQLAPLVVIHGHSEVVVRPIVPVAPAAGVVIAPGDTVYVHALTKMNTPRPRNPAPPAPDAASPNEASGQVPIPPPPPPPPP